VRSCAHGSGGSIPAPHRVAVVQGSAIRCSCASQSVAQYSRIVAPQDRTICRL